MSQAHPIHESQPESLIPASRIMRERAEAKEAWARELTRAESLERENASLRSQLDAMRARDLRNIDDLTDLYRGAKDRIDQLTAENARLLADAAGDIAQQAALKAMIDQQKSDHANVTKRLRDKINEERDLIAELLRNNDIGTNCETCLGDGEIALTRFNGYEDRRTGRFDDCPDCYKGRICR